ncbi:MAG: hypothetical protein ACI4E0_13925 [Blautia sp.]
MIQEITSQEQSGLKTEAGSKNPASSQAQKDGQILLASPVRDNVIPLNEVKDVHFT